MTQQEAKRMFFSKHNCHRWLNCPEFLKLEEYAWPTEKKAKTEEEYENCEYKAELVAVISSGSSSERLPDVTRLPYWLRLIRTTAWVRRFRK